MYPPGGDGEKPAAAALQKQSAAAKRVWLQCTANGRWTRHGFTLAASPRGSHSLPRQGFTRFGYLRVTPCGDRSDSRTRTHPDKPEQFAERDRERGDGVRMKRERERERGGERVDGTRGRGRETRGE